MSLATAQPIAFIPTLQPEVARHFYEDTLGLTFVTDNDFAIVFHVGQKPQIMLRIVRVRDFTPPAHTVFGWAVDDIARTVDDLAASGIQFLRYSYFQQDERGIWSAPDDSALPGSRTRTAIPSPSPNTLSDVHRGFTLALQENSPASRRSRGLFSFGCPGALRSWPVQLSG